MPFAESISVSLFLMAIVFTVLCGLFLSIRLISAVLAKPAPAAPAPAPVPAPLPASAPVSQKPAEPWPPEVCLHDVDSKTAALLMAVVADETGIPLPELRFRSIKEVPGAQSGTAR